MTSIQTAVDHFRDAAIMPERWTQALDALSQALRSEGATLLIPPTRAEAIVCSSSIQPFMPQYLANLDADSRESRVCPRLTQGFMTDHAYFSPSELARDPYYQEFLVPRGFGWNAAAMLEGDLLISMKRGRRRGAYDGADLSLLNEALPGLRAASRAASLTWRSRFAGQLSAFERLGRGALLIDRHARVLDMNACVEFGDGLDLRAGSLHVPRATDRTRLQRFLAAVTRPSDRIPPGSTTLALPRPSNRRPWVLDGIACGDALQSLHSRAAGLLIITDMSRAAAAAPAALSQIFGLTPVEAALASDLANGHALQEVAARLSISEAHARQRLKAVFLKTGTARQGELIALLSKLLSRGNC